MIQTLTPVSRIDASAWSWLTDRMHYMAADFTQAETFTHLEKSLAKQREQNSIANVLFYLAVGERFFGPIVEQLGRAGLTKQSGGAWRRVIIEKPFGHDLSSAKALNAQILKVLSEDQIYRIDHFLGKETVQNMKATALAPICSNVVGTSPELLETPALSNKITSRSRARPSVTAGSQ
jgi:glucose-6-phosphate 1-dehydrogenase